MKVYPRDGPQPRVAVSDTTEFPYRAVGYLGTMDITGTRRQDCTATLVGPRHILTASHCATWGNYRDDSPPVNPIGFFPGYKNGLVYDRSWVIYSYWLRKIEAEVLEDWSGDWLVGVLDRYMNTTNGQFDLQLYDRQWTGKSLFNMIGYPYNWIPQGMQVFQGPSAVQRVDDTPYGQVFYWDGVGVGGDSGAPIYGIFDGRPSLIGLVSGLGIDDFTVVGHGGLPLFRLITTALKEHP